MPRRTVIVAPAEKSYDVYGPPQDPTDFLWLMTEEPHRSRRMAIMKAHPEVRGFVHLGGQLIDIVIRSRSSWATNL